jgi:hypothetical protein
MPPQKVLSQAVRVVGCVGRDLLVAHVALDVLVVHHAPVAAHSAIEKRIAAPLHLGLRVRAGKVPRVEHS